MADAVERALREERVLFCEAGTGTGKTLAYLLPAVLSGKKVVISTATRALQEQIVAKDLPLIERAFGLRPRAAVMKGLANYLCLRRYREFGRSSESLRPGYARALGALASWVGETDSGDISELAMLAEEDAIWREVTASSETRLGSSCSHHDECFVTRMKRDAEAAQLVIVNHHLFFADLALRGPHPARVLPDYDAVVFDEAHQLEDIATDFFGMRITQAQVERLLRDAQRALAAAGVADPLFAGPGAQVIFSEVQQATFALFEELTRGAPAEDARATIERDAWQGPLAERWHRLDGALESFAALLDTMRGRISGFARSASASEAGDALEVAIRRSDLIREHLAAIVDGARGRVTWFERSAKSASLSSSPVDLSYVFRSRVFETIPAVVLTSATLTNHASEKPEAAQDGTAKSPFAFVRERLGVSDAGVEVTELVVPSPFDFERRALFYAPRDLPAPNTPSFIPAATERIAALVNITDGGAFVLTTSLRSMRALREGLAAALPERTLFIQGQMPKGPLIGAFRAAQNAVLVATSSFWEGVDVPGRALRLVVLEKIPFPVPSDPIVQARTLALEAEGKNSFMDYHVPTAALSLKQGFGRLIRSHADAGIVALLDERVHRRGYGRRLLAGLPNARRTSVLGDVERFWGELDSEPSLAGESSAP